jgi:hypothetical protein
VLVLVLVLVLVVAGMRTRRRHEEEDGVESGGRARRLRGVSMRIERMHTGFLPIPMTATADAVLENTIFLTTTADLDDPMGDPSRRPALPSPALPRSPPHPATSSDPKRATRGWRPDCAAPAGAMWPEACGCATTRAQNATSNQRCCITPGVERNGVINENAKMQLRPVKNGPFHRLIQVLRDPFRERERKNLIFALHWEGRGGWVPKKRRGSESFSCPEREVVLRKATSTERGGETGGRWGAGETKAGS